AHLLPSDGRFVSVKLGSSDSSMAVSVVGCL
ncbi:hypothetical protein A2U01_0097639, partial [Trifolium medium]|nr:hypothetical protein [Trifolium medium]